MTEPAPPPAAELAHLVERFEAALARDPAADLATFLPAPSHPLYLVALAELVRVDLDLAWARRRPKRLADYRGRFPALFADPASLREVAFEEYRQRRQAGEAVTAEEYRAAYGIDPSDRHPSEDEPTQRSDNLPGNPASVRTQAAAIRPLDQTPPPSGTARSDAESLSRWFQAGGGLPAVGTKFLGFHLDEELGRGAFGRVYLARQGSLAGRPVALKVGCDIFGESQTLAQLQHTNIVPVYSFHQVGRLQAVCMPYFGRTTLAQVLKQISVRPSLPHSGRELRSTVNVAHDSTRRTADEPAAAPMAPPPAPAHAESPEGWPKLEGLSYVGAVLWLGEQIADGLAHAHDRGIAHRDLKPANVLLTDEGRPMILDFNLADDAKFRSTAEGAAVGGTLPYMAPEQLEAFRTGQGKLDTRTDLFSLGVVLFELLTGRHPFPLRRGPTREVVAAMLADRRRPPAVRRCNPAVSPAVESIVQKLLSPDPAWRYQTAHELREDLDRQLSHRPLRHAPDRSARERLAKWRRRHPRLTSSGAVAAVAAALLLATGAAAAYARERGEDARARAALADHRAEFRDAQTVAHDRAQVATRPTEALDRLRKVLDRYGVPPDGGTDSAWLDSSLVARLPEAEQQQLRADVGETFYLMAQVAYIQARLAIDPQDRDRYADLADKWAAAAGRYSGDRLDRAVRAQAELARAATDADRDRLLREEAKRSLPESAREQYLLGVLFAQSGRYRDALPLLRSATQADPDNFSAWFVRGGAHLALEQNELAALCFGSCTAIRKDFAPAWFNRALAFSRMRLFEASADDCDRAIALDPGYAEAYVLRAYARAAQGDRAGAVDDYGRALATGSAPVRIYFLRAAVRQRLGDLAGAAADREEGFRHEPRDEQSWVARAEQRLVTADANGALGGSAVAARAVPAAALADVERGLALNPLSMHGLQMKAHVLAELLDRPGEAAAALDRAVELYPDYAPARAGRGVLLARAGKRDEALRDARDALLADTKAPNLYQVGCIYALTSAQNPDDRREAFRLLWAALRTGFAVSDGLVDTDSDLGPLRGDPEFDRLVRNAKALHGRAGR